jgi:hypothetical protein
MENVTYIGDYSFTYTALTQADLTSATHIGTHAFMKETMTDFTVKLGENLSSLGDNPFALCKLPAFTSTSVESFNGKDYETVIYTFDLGEKIRVIDGILYRVVPNGLELITYAGDEKTVSVATDTVRITARAFEGSSVQNVLLPYTLAAIGHKAFYACDDMALVTFTSYKSPILEEEYDLEHFNSGKNIPATGEYTFQTLDGKIATENGLGLLPYFMWNAADLPNNIYYGANFIDHIGHIEHPIVMVRPVNGQYYDSFILDQYFSVVIDGAAAADEVTLAAIAAINRLPENLTLADKHLVVAAREAYNRISTMEQRALVTNYDVLEQAEKRIADLEFLEMQNNQPEPPVEAPLAVVPFQFPTYAKVLIAIAACLILIRVIFAAVDLTRKQKQKALDASDADATTQEKSEDDSEDA